MSSNTKWVVGVIGVIVVVAVLWFAFGRQGTDSMTPEPATGGTTEAPAPAPAPEGGTGTTTTTQ